MKRQIACMLAALMMLPAVPVQAAEKEAVRSTIPLTAPISQTACSTAGI